MNLKRIPLCEKMQKGAREEDTSLNYNNHDNFTLVTAFVIVRLVVCKVPASP